MPIPLALILAGLTAGGGILNRWMGTQDIKRQNLYNTPANQVRRLREAGLPYAAMTDAISGNQSQVPENPDFIKDGIGSYVQNTMMQKQMELLDAQIDATEAQADKTEVEGNKIASELQIYNSDPYALDPVSFGARKAKNEMEYERVRNEMQLRSQEIQNLEYKLKKDLTEDGTLASITRNQLKALINSLTLSNQSINRGKALDNIIKRMENNGMSLWEALLLTIAMGQVGTGNIHFPTINTGDNTKHIHIDRN